MRDALLIGLLGLITPSCRTADSHSPGQLNPASATAALEVRFEPPGHTLFKLEGDLATENWAFGLRVRGEVGRLERLRIEHSSAGAIRHVVELDRTALNAHRAEPHGGGLLLGHLYQQLPARLAIDRLRVVLFDGEQEIGRAEVPLMRYEQKNRFRLPVSGCWFVSSGHDFGIEHRRWYNRSHFAWDLIRVNEAGEPGAGPALAESFSFGQPVVTPAAGTVLEVRDGGEDQAPGHPGSREEANFVLIDHGAGEHSRLVHLKKGSIRVRPGEHLQANQLIGEVGNSGMTDGPHLHVAFETQGVDASTGERVSVPLPIRFSGYRLTWNQGTRMPMEMGRPRRGQFICAD
jgi:murein DD-endopeptidase MepM/ murein hydrolase activator NlpD